MNHPLSPQNSLPPQDKERLEKIFQSVFNRESDTESSENICHFAEDLDFLERLDSDSLTPKERKALIDHLADCPSCREKITLFTQCGLLWSESDEDEPSQNNSASENTAAVLPSVLSYSPRRRRKKQIPWWAATLMSVVLVFVYITCKNIAKWSKSAQLPLLESSSLDDDGGGFVSRSTYKESPKFTPHDSQSTESRNRDFSQEEHKDSRTTSEIMLTESAPKETAVSRSVGLSNRTLESQREERGKAGSSQLPLFYAIPQEEETEDELSLSDMAIPFCLTDFSYLLTGEVKKNDSENTANDDPKGKATENYLRGYTQTAETRCLQSALSLLQQGEADHAVGILKELTAEIDESNRNEQEIELLLGIGEVMRGQDAEAQRHFRRILTQPQWRKAALINLAISLYRTGQRQDAASIYREVQDGMSFADKKKIDKLLGERSDFHLPEASSAPAPFNSLPGPVYH